jgi:protein-S-isoprenylcysteine O-methyltransferase Ste14
MASAQRIDCPKGMPTACVLFRVRLIGGMQATVWIPALIESVVVLANHGLLPGKSNDDVLRLLAGRDAIANTFSFLLLLGAIFALVGTTFRMSAYRTMGKHFTFQLALRKDHTLVTAYPYNVVRHPSYTGYLATMGGSALALGTPDGWVRAALLPWLASAPATPAKVCAAACLALGLATYVFVTVMFLSRVTTEDTMLRRRFGSQWVAWADRVPHKIVPLVF